MISSGHLGGPLELLMMSTGFEVIAVELVESAPGESEFLGGGFGFDLTSAETSQHMTG